MKKRGSIYLWVSEEAIEKWQSPKDPDFIGASKQYSDDAILCMMALKVVYHSPYRQLVGFVLSIFALLKVTLKVPHFTTVANRAKLLGKYFKKLSKVLPTDLIIE